MTKVPEVSIVIRCYNEEHRIGRLLSGIMQQTIKDVEIIVVDSGSTDTTLSVVSRYPARILSTKSEDFSFGHSLNMGCEKTSGQFIVIASAHVYPIHRDWLERLLAPFRNDKVALVYGRQRGNDVTKYSEHQVFTKWFPDKSNWDQGHPFCNNANAAIRRSVWERFRYDESLTGLEDIAWAKEIRGAGYKVAYEAGAEIVHVHDESPKRLHNRYQREAIAFRRIFPHERFQLWDFIRLFTGNVISDCYHAWYDGVLWRNVASIFTFRLMQFSGTYRGFRQHDPITSSLKQKFYYPNELAWMVS